MCALRVRRRGVPKHIGGEPPARERGAVWRGAWAGMAREVQQHRPWMDLAPLEMGRHSRGAVQIRTVTGGGIVVEAPLEELMPSSARSRLASGRKVKAGRGVRLFEGVTLQRSHPHDGASLHCWCGPAMITPGAGVWREHLVVAAGLVEDLTRTRGVRTPGPHHGHTMMRDA